MEQEKEPNITSEQNEAIELWPDEQLAEFAKHVAKHLVGKQNDEGVRSMTAGSTGAAIILINLALNANAEEVTLTMTNHTIKGVSTGDWEIRIRQVALPEKQE